MSEDYNASQIQGKNVIVVCQAEMKRLLQGAIANLLLSPATLFEVTKIEADEDNMLKPASSSEGSAFKITIEPKKPESNPSF